MVRTQLYLDDDVADAIRLRSRETGLSISELVRQAIREKYLAEPDRHKRAMQAFVDIWKNRREFADSDSYIRKLRKGHRLDRLAR